MEHEFDMAKIATFPTFDPAEHLESEEDIAVYLAECAKETDPAVVTGCQDVVNRARARIAAKS